MIARCLMSISCQKGAEGSFGSFRDVVEDEVADDGRDESTAAGEPMTTRAVKVGRRPTVRGALTAWLVASMTM
jgi:hypothetical protein